MANLPPFLDPHNALAPKEMRESVQKMTGGTPERFKLNTLLIRDESARSIDDVLRATGYGVERVKLYSGSAHARGDIEDVFAASREHGITPYIGGGIFEKKKSAEINQIANVLEGMNVDTVEISNDHDAMSLREFRALVKELKKRFQSVLVEVGRKGSDEPIDMSVWNAELEMALELEATDIVLEGGGNGNLGMYTSEGNMKSLATAMLHERARTAGMSPIIEAAQAVQQGYLTCCGGFPWDTRIGNALPTITAQTQIATFRMASMTKKGDAENKRRIDRLSRLLEYVSQTPRMNAMNLNTLVNDAGMLNVCMCKDSNLTNAKISVDEVMRNGKSRAGVRMQRTLQMRDLFGGSSFSFAIDDEE